MLNALTLIILTFAWSKPFFQMSISYLSSLFSPPHCGELFQAWEMWLSPHSEKPVGSEVGGRDPRPWISSPVGNQACIVPRLLWDLLLLKTLSPWSKQMFTEYLYLPKIWARPSRYGTLPFWSLLPLHCKCPPLMYSATPSPLSAKDNHPKQTFA